MPAGGRRAGAGRPAGSGWKPALLNLRGMAHESLAQVLGTAKDPLHIVLEAAADPDLDIQVRLGACNIALQYLYPKLSATQVQSHNTSVKVDATDLLARLKDRIARLAPPEPETPVLARIMQRI
jgi:hypothetical protein